MEGERTGFEPPVDHTVAQGVHHSSTPPVATRVARGSLLRSSREGITTCQVPTGSRFPVVDSPFHRGGTPLLPGLVGEETVCRRTWGHGGGGGGGAGGGHVGGQEKVNAPSDRRLSRRDGGGGGYGSTVTMEYTKSESSPKLPIPNRTMYGLAIDIFAIDNSFALDKRKPEATDTTQLLNSSLAP